MDVDDLFDAIEDVILVDRDPLPAPMTAALDELTAAWEAASGAGPVDELVAAAITVCMTTSPDLPATVSAAVSRLHTALPGEALIRRRRSECLGEAAPCGHLRIQDCGVWFLPHGTPIM